MKWLVKWALRLFLAVVALIVLLLLSKDTILRLIIENRIRARTGMEVKIGKYSSGIFSPVMTIENLRLYNTPEFGGTLFLEIPEIHFKLDTAALAHREIHVTLARFNVSELNVVHNEAGQTNLYSIVDSIHRRNPRRKHGEKWFGNFEFTGIDVLNITLGKGRLIDLKDNRNNCETVIDLRDQVFKNVNTDEDLHTALILLYLRSGGEYCFVSREEVENLLFGKAVKKLMKLLPKSPPGGTSTPSTNRPAKRT